MLTNPRLSQLSDAEFRALVTLWAWVARYGKDGEFPRIWLRNFVWKGRRRVTQRMFARFLELDLVEEFVYTDDGST